MEQLPPLPAHIHIVGIGGAGMSAIARVLLARGYTISGSDREKNTATDSLERSGATIFIGHAADYIGSARLVLISSAIAPDNPEVRAAQLAGVPVLKRRDALGAITAGYDVIAVAGTHGKTTTTALLVHLLRETGHDPTYIIGGTLLNTGTNAGVGLSKYFVIEADEYDYMFLGLSPKYAVITNIEHDHPDMFPTLTSLMDAFRQFLGKLREDGIFVGYQNDVNVNKLISELNSGAHRRLTIPFSNNGVTGNLANLVGGLDALPPSLSGTHNQLDALAAAVVATMINRGKEGIGEAIKTFRGTARRMEFMGIAASGAQIYNDYGHHPTAIRATLQGARQRFGTAPIWAVWQPHTFSRTHLLADEFAAAFKDAQHTLITDVFASREPYTPGPGPAEIAHMAQDHGHPDIRPSGDLTATAQMLKAETKPGDIVIVFSAGDAPKIATMLIKGQV
jgi:UDP-N-acetylmuramate--alanine ligase